MAQLAAPLMIASTLVSAVGTIAAGNAADNAAQYEAEQLESRAGQERAAAQRRAIEQRRQARLVQSRQQAAAAASGAGASDPTVVDLMTGAEGEGEYRALLELYEGEERARGATVAANVRRFEGKQAKTASYIGAAGTILGGASTFFEKYK